MDTGDGCTVNGNIQTIELKLWNQHDFDGDVGWNETEFNPYYRDFTVSGDLATCSTILVGLGRQTPPTLSVLIDEISFGHLSTLSPTVSYSSIEKHHHHSKYYHVLILKFILLGYPNISSYNSCSSSNYGCSCNGISFTK